MVLSLGMSVHQHVCLLTECTGKRNTKWSWAQICLNNVHIWELGKDKLWLKQSCIYFEVLVSERTNSILFTTKTFNIWALLNVPLSVMGRVGECLKWYGSIKSHTELKHQHYSGGETQKVTMHSFCDYVIKALPPGIWNFHKVTDIAS